MTKPDWKDAPASAKFLARNMYGEWDFFDSEPKIYKRYWVVNGTTILEKKRGPNAPLFEMIKEERPIGEKNLDTESDGEWELWSAEDDYSN